jgi:hypothetical protein
LLLIPQDQVIHRVRRICMGRVFRVHG